MSNVTASLGESGKLGSSIHACGPNIRFTQKYQNKFVLKVPDKMTHFAVIMLSQVSCKIQ